MRRRAFIAGVTAAATPVLWPPAARAQQPGIPVIGFLTTGSPEVGKEVVSNLRGGLRDAGYIEGQNVAIEFRWGNNLGILRQLASELVNLQVAVIVACGAVNSQLAAKAATSTIPIVMAGGADPVKLGLVASLSRPGGNITGVTFILNELAGKRLDLLLKVVPTARTVGYLVGNAVDAIDPGELLTAAQALGRQIIVLECRGVSDFEKAFATLIERQAGAVVVSAFPIFFNNRNKIVVLAAHHKMPAIYPQPQYVNEGGLMSYGVGDVARQVAIQYVARIHQGCEACRPSDPAANRLQACYQLEDRKSAWSRNSSGVARTGRSGDRVTGSLRGQWKRGVLGSMHLLDDRFHESCHNRGIHLDFSDSYIGRVCPNWGLGHGSVAAGD